MCQKVQIQIRPDVMLSVRPDLGPNCLNRSSANNLQIFQNQCFKKNILRIPSQYQTVLDPDQAQQNVRPDLGPNCLQKLSAENSKS